ncbi:MAG TPA: efflux RND transporter periplasmic adaptor subunit [Stellaceae bacterium]|nr:efflux RND transporter periplasmic adaptor subunit [Stellaceae bacterium]
MLLGRVGLVALAFAAAWPAAAAERAVVTRRLVADEKAVIATVEPVHELYARARIGGTITEVKVKEGDAVSAGDRIAMVVDQKLMLQTQALQARIQAQEAERDQAQIDFTRAQTLRKTGAGTQVALDQAKTRLDVAKRQLQALHKDQAVVEQETAEGAVFAPGAGRVLKVPVSEGSVVLGGEQIASIAQDRYILRLQLPERHAQSMRAGDTILVGERGLAARYPAAEPMRKGRVVLVYPEIDKGRVIADVEVAGLGNYFVGERTRVYVATGERPALVIPEGYLYRRFGVSYVRLGDGTEVVVQPGMPVEGGIEILAGLNAGDVVEKP